MAYSPNEKKPFEDLYNSLVDWSYLALWKFLHMRLVPIMTHYLETLVTP